VDERIEEQFENYFIWLNEYLINKNKKCIVF
jgi:hypothetical protein